MRPPLTPVQSQALDMIRRYTRKHGHAPTVSMLAAMRKRVQSSTHHMIRKLERKGYVVMDRHQRYSLQVIEDPKELQIRRLLRTLGRIAMAGDIGTAVRIAQEALTELTPNRE